MTDTTLAGTPAAELARLVRDGVRSAREVTASHLAHIAGRDDAVGAFQLIRADAALAEADRIDALPREQRQLPLAGVPVAIKDNVPVAGEPMRFGSRTTPSAPSPADHEVVARLRAAGAVVVGITRVPELCLWGTSDSDFGVARTPWRLDRTAGGSSGGSAAAVSSAMVPIAHGNDGLGSIRIPAACCGLVGIKPGRGIVPADLGSNSWCGMAENGALATTVEDAALMLSVMAGDASLARIDDAPGPLRIALSMSPPAAGIGVDRVLAAHAREVAAALESLGHSVVEVRAPRPSPLGVLAILGTWGSGARAEVDALVDGDTSAWGRLERRTRGHARMGDVANLLGLAGEAHRLRWRARMDEFLGRFDLIMTPTLARQPLAADGWRARGWLANLVANLTYAPYCGSANFARIPAVAVPAGIHPAGTPTSVHFTAGAGRERTLLAVAAQVERLRPWPRHAPQCAGPVSGRDGAS